MAIKGLGELKINIERFKDETRNALKRTAFHGATLVQNDAKSNHGSNAHAMGRFISRHGGSGLVGSIQIKKPVISSNKIRVEVIAGMKYAYRVELFYPYMFPALESQKNAFKDYAKKAIQMIRWVN